MEPEISPNGEFVVFKFTKGASVINEIWIMDRNGQNVFSISGIMGWDPTWSPDGSHILFASDVDGTIQLYAVLPNGEELRKVSSLPAIRGRSDMSPDGKYIVTYSGEAWKREVYIMNSDGSNARVLSPAGGNSQGASFSPDGQWVTFTSYYDHPNDENGCEIYIIRVDGTDLRRLTNNDYCDYQPRWGLVKYVLHERRLLFCAPVFDQKWQVKDEEDHKPDCFQLEDIPGPGSERVQQGGKSGLPATKR